MVSIADVFARVQSISKTRIAGEHAYRPIPHDLLEALGDHLTPVKDATKADIGARDLIVDIPIGHLPSKGIRLDIRNLKDAKKMHQDRYYTGLANLIHTNCLDWECYRHCPLCASVTIAENPSGIQPKSEEHAILENLLRNFVAQLPKSITPPRSLAERMAGEAVLNKNALSQTPRLDKDQQTDHFEPTQASQETTQAR